MFVQWAGSGRGRSAHLCVNLARPFGVWVMHVAHTQRGQMHAEFFVSIFPLLLAAVRAHSVCHLTGVLVRTAVTIPSRIRPTDNLLDFCLSKQPMLYIIAMHAGWQMSMSILLVAKRCQAFTLNLAAATCSEFVFPNSAKRSNCPFWKVSEKKGEGAWGRSMWMGWGLDVATKWSNLFCAMLSLSAGGCRY